MSTIVYLLQVSACTAVFYLFYFLFLRRYTFFSLNRFYLLGTLLLSFVIPVVKLPQDLPQPAPIFHQMRIVQDAVTVATPRVTSAATRSNYLELFPVLYSLVAGLICLHLAASVLSLTWRIYKSRREKKGRINVVRNAAHFSNGSFFHYIFINDRGLTEHQSEQIVRHELAHVRLLHSVDVILARLVRALLWFNPFSYLYFSAIRGNHEFEADRAVASGSDPKSYAELLFSLASPDQSSLYSSFSMIPLKQRIVMLFHKPTRQMKKLVYFLVAPLIALSCLAFAGRKMSSSLSQSYNTPYPVKMSDDHRVFRSVKMSAEPAKERVGAEIDRDTVPERNAKFEAYKKKVDSIVSRVRNISERASIEPVAAVENSIYTRQVYTGKDGKLFDRVAMGSSSESGINSIDIPHNGKVAIVVQGKLYTEDDLAEVTRLLALKRGWVRSAGEQVAVFDGIDVSAFDGVHGFTEKIPVLIKSKVN